MIAGHLSDWDFQDAIHAVHAADPGLRAEDLTDAAFDRLAVRFDPDGTADTDEWADFWDLVNEYVQRFEERRR